MIFSIHKTSVEQIKSIPKSVISSQHKVCASSSGANTLLCLLSGRIQLEPRKCMFVQAKQVLEE